ncbi:hypothetical protein [Nocardioides sp. SYSU D00038]|uniref:hypothetical protein n=1 Tax=Nocardioides sp. SYSU D00038 TaxID=2812554 RepID=UPI00196736BE|nr:hypothetical protein [Nocardioides sp. SYSU D00038]
MTEQPAQQDEDGRGAAEEQSGVPDTAEEHQGPVSPSSTPSAGEPSRTDGYAEEEAGVDDA